VPVAFNRKEAKAHGEGGTLIGAPVRGRVLIVDDVITAGTAIRESIQAIRAAGGEPCGVLIALDRQERGQAGDRSAAQEVTAEFGLPVFAVAGLDDLLAHADERPELAEHKDALVAYRSAYGSRS
jgi:orotate phosphoribosyltransferase